MNAAIRRAISAASVTFALTATLSHATIDQPGTLDPFWATGSPLGAGKVMTPVGVDNDFAYAVALQPDGKVVLAGGCVVSHVIFCALRYNANGTVDASFGSGGSVVTAVGPDIASANAIALQPDGKLVLAGTCFNGTNFDFCALRYNANGTLDASFGSSGTVVTPVGANDDNAYALALQPDGKIVLAGACYNGTNNDFCALRYSANGTLDAGFGSSGKVITPVGTGADLAYAAALQPDGKVVLAGFCSNGANSDVCAVRYNSNGTPDAGFGSGGKVITALGGANDAATALAVQPDGKLVLAGYCSNGTNYDFCALRYNSNGALDTTFGSSGKVITAIGSNNDSTAALALQPDGKLLLAGYCTNGAANDFCALRYHANGSLDTSLGSAGKVMTPVGAGDDSARAISLQPDGKMCWLAVAPTAPTATFAPSATTAGRLVTKTASWTSMATGRCLPAPTC